MMAKKKKNQQRTEALVFQVTEAYKKARTNLVYSLIKKGCKKIIFTSPFKSEGKTTTAANVAIALSQQAGTRVIIIDCDLRRPTTHTVLGIKSEKGLANLLNNECELSEVVTKTSHENLDIITYGAVPPNPSELLSSAEMSDLVEQLEKEYDYIIFDTPPVNMVVDVVPLIGLADGVVLVIRHNLTTTPEFNKAVDTLKRNNAKILGVIINRVPAVGTAKGNYYITNY
jgi:capsular exopolysaccharide synthesis family protein